MPFSFAPNGTSAVSATSVRGRGVSVARNDVGNFTVTINVPCVAVIAATADVAMAAASVATVNKVSFGVMTAGSTATLVLQNVNSTTGAAADIAADAANRIHGVAYLQIGSS